MRRQQITNNLKLLILSIEKYFSNIDKPNLKVTVLLLK